LSVVFRPMCARARAGGTRRGRARLCGRCGLAVAAEFPVGGLAKVSVDRWSPRFTARWLTGSRFTWSEHAPRRHALL